MSCIHLRTTFMASQQKRKSTIPANDWPNRSGWAIGAYSIMMALRVGAPGRRMIGRRADGVARLAGEDRRRADGQRASGWRTGIQRVSTTCGLPRGRWGRAIANAASPTLASRKRARGPCGRGRAASALWGRGPKRPWSGSRGHPGTERRLAVADALAGIPGRALGFDARRCTAAPCRRHPPKTAPVHEHDID